MAKYRVHSCDSAQSEVFNRLSQGEKDLMVFCDHQTKGEGRRQRPWFAAKKAVAMSFDLTPNEKLSLTSLELGVLACGFLQSKGLQAKLKWPNDLCLPDGKKCGGILIQSKNGSLVAGIGVNLYHPKNEVPLDLENKMACLFDKDAVDPWDYSCALYRFINSNRMSPGETVTKWNQLCGHLKKEVLALEDKEQIKGRFLGIGEDGEALIETPLEIKRVYNASLIIL